MAQRVNYELALEATIMALRENLMTYYKGSCVDRFVRQTNVCAIATSSRGGHYYQRREREMHNDTILAIADTPIAQMSSLPDTLLVYENILMRSPELTEVKIQLEKLMQKYLQGVIVESNTTEPAGRATSDRKLILHNMPVKQVDPYIALQEDFEAMLPGIEALAVYPPRINPNGYRYIDELPF